MTTDGEDRTLIIDQKTGAMASDVGRKNCSAKARIKPGDFAAPYRVSKTHATPRAHSFLFRLEKSGEMLIKNGDITGGMKLCQDVIDLGESMAQGGTLNTPGYGVLLTALLNVGAIHEERGELAMALRYFRRAIVLVNSVTRYEALDEHGRSMLLNALCNATKLLLRLGDDQDAMRQFQLLIMFGAPVDRFISLDKSGREAVLAGIVLISQALYFLHGDKAGTLNNLRQVISLGWARVRFKVLTESGQSAVLAALTNGGHLLSELGKHAEAINYYQRAITLGDPKFHTLNNEACYRVLLALLRVGHFYEIKGDSSVAIKHYRCIINLGMTKYKDLNTNGRSTIVDALVNLGVQFHKASKKADAIGYYKDAILLGEPIAQFKEFDTDTREKILSAYSYTGALLDADGFGGADYYRRAIVLLELANGFEQLSMFGRYVLMGILTSYGSRLGRCDAGKQFLTLASLLARLDPRPNYGIENKVVGKKVSAFTWLADMLRPTVSWHSALSTLRWWIINMRAYPVRGDRPLQRRAVVQLAGTLGNLDAHELLLGHRRLFAATKALHGAAPANEREVVAHLRQTRIDHWSDWASDQTLRVLPQAAPLSNPARMLLARIRADAESSDCWPEAAPWRRDISSLYRACGVEMLFQDQRISPPAYWLVQARQIQFGPDALKLHANDTTGELSKALLAWHGGDSGRVVELLEQAWNEIALDGGIVEEKWVSTISRLAEWFQWLGTDIWAAISAAQDALIYGNAKNALKNAFAEWIGRQLASAGKLTELDRRSDDVLRLLFGRFSRFGSPAPDKRVLDRLHLFLDKELDACCEEPDAVWVALEKQRFALSSTASLRHVPRVPDKTTQENLEVATEAEAVYLEHRAKLAAQGLADTTANPEHDDLIFPFMTAVGTELDRLGYSLRLPTPDACATVMAHDEALVQLWFAKNNEARLLILIAVDGKPDLRSVPLSSAVSKQQWQDLLDLAELARQGERRSANGSQTYKFPTQGEIPAKDEIQNVTWSEVWSRFVARDSVATRFVAELVRSLARGDATRRCITLILPAPIACLPWIARASHAGTTGTPELESGKLILDSSVNAWLQSRSGKVLTTIPSPTGRVVHMVESNDIAEIGQLEAAVAGQALGAKPEVAHGALKLVAALQHQGPVHLVIHGKFVPGAVAESYLTTDGAHPDLPAWLIPALDLPGNDISLSACESALIDWNENSSAGPIGFAAMLRAANAQCVCANTGIQNRLASLVFYRLYHEARETLSAVEALAVAQARMRTMERDDAKAFIKAICTEKDIDAIWDAIAGLRDVRIGELRKLWIQLNELWSRFRANDRWKKLREVFDCLYNAAQKDDVPAENTRPFADPVLWSRFVILGNAAPRHLKSRRWRDRLRHAAKQRFAQWLQWLQRLQIKA